MMKIENEKGVDKGWIKNGGMLIERKKERIDEYRRLDKMGVSFGIEY